MDHAIIPREQTTGEASPLSPLAAFVAWLANFLRTIAGMKRRQVFPKNWKDHWPGLRELEWYRDQILAFSAKHVLSGGSLDHHTDLQLIETVPEGYGVCPNTPRAMNRRFIAMAQFRLSPDKYIQRHIRRIAKRAGMTLRTDTSGCPLRLAARATSPNARHWGRKEIERASSRPGRGSRQLALIAQARAPPTPISMFESPVPVPQTLRA